MTKKSFYIAAAFTFAFGLILMGVAYAQRPETDINSHRHPNLAEAQRHVVEAYNKTVDAEKANHDELDGHGERAIDLLDHANHELKLAAEASDRHRP